ncbi:MAG TPA: SCO6880 family protein [Streptosporangiaceae bacterium]|nr:SCO6880 family protein [Streptosporangiaceae bacterium]
MNGRDQTYRGWQHERVSFLLGMSGRRTALVALAVLVAVQPVSAGRLSDALVAWPVAAILIMIACLRAGGRTVDEWMVIAMSFQLLKARGQNRFHSGAFAPASPSDPAGPQPLDLPGVLAPIRILAAETGTGRTMAVLYHPHDRTYTAVARIESAGIGLTDTSRRDGQVSGWGRFLAGLCTENHPIMRVQAIQRSLPDEAAGLRSWHENHLVSAAPAQALAVTAELLSDAAPASVRREEWLAFTMDERRAAAAIRAAGGGEAGACAVLARQVRSLAAAVSDAELEVAGWLTPRELAEVFRTAFDPESGEPLGRRRYAEESATASGREHTGLPAGTDPRLAGPVRAEALWGSYRHDSGVSVCYQIYDWPRGEVYSTALFPLLGDGTSRRAVSLYLQPLSPREAERQVLAERTQRDVAIRMRQRTGQIVPEHEKAAQRRAEEQDAERAAGHGLVRFSGYVSATVTDSGDIADAMAALEADAAAARIEIRRMWGAQDVGFALAALPAGLGLPQRRW